MLSRNPISFPPVLPTNVTPSSKSPQELIEHLSREGTKHIYVDGGNTIQRFHSEDLIDEIIITVIPLILGDGIPLFGSPGTDVKLTHVNTIVFEFGFVQTTYSVKKNA